MSATPKEVRKARAFLYGRGITGRDINPRRFANTAKELNIGFQQLLQFIARMYAGGQGQQQFRLDVIAKEVQKEREAA